jgi:hypothetical protein
MEGASHIVLRLTKGALKTVDAFDFFVEARPLLLFSLAFDPILSLPSPPSGKPPFSIFVRFLMFNAFTLRTVGNVDQPTNVKVSLFVYLLFVFLLFRCGCRGMGALFSI